MGACSKMKPHHKRMLEWVASQLDTSLKIQERRDWRGRRVRWVGFNYIPEEYDEDWKNEPDWAKEFESARLESIRMGQSWIKEQQESQKKK